jgi:hypothetical protein
MADEVSTTCGSGWVDDQLCDIRNDFECVRLTHPLPQVVLTVSSGINDFCGKPLIGSLA